MTGTIIKSTGSNYLVRDNGSGAIIPCKIRGKLRLDGIKSTNPVAVGDVVDYDMETSGDVGVISNIQKRQNCIVRRATNLSRQSQVIAANIDQCLIVTTLIMPETPLEFVDRFLVSAEAYKVTPIIVFNKCDLCKDEGIAEELKRRIDLYTKIGYRCHCTSSVTGEGIDTLREILRDKTTLLSGRSGTGKSTLINTINPGLNLRTGEISSAHLDGKHTTTFAEMFPLSFGGYVVDTPGIRSFGTAGLSNEDVAHNFPEFFSRLSECRFYNCTHTNEPGCAVKAAVESGEIEFSRYESYLSICFEDGGKHRMSRKEIFG
ncbi:MAG: ribosome small subunit-dependent GTPase A [Bacteroidales bacterium]|nr:ribosome small subunit-dependent GTPase A [Bacteroidales bacterium]